MSGVTLLGAFLIMFLFGSIFDLFFGNSTALKTAGSPVNRVLYSLGAFALLVYLSV